MNYVKHKWVTREVIREQYLNHIEDGIYNEEFRARTAEDYLNSLINNEAERAINAENTTNTNVANLRTDVTNLQNAVNTINGGIAVPGSIDYKIQAALSEANGSVIVPSLESVTEPDISRLYFVEDSTTHTYNGYMYVYTNNVGEWVCVTTSSGGGSSTLADLTDTVITNPSSGQILKYNGTAWVNDAAPSGNLAGLTDTNITSIADKQILQYDSSSSKWVNTTQKIMISQTLSAGSTAVTFTSGIPSGDYEVSVLTSKIGLDYIQVSSVSNGIKVTFDAQSEAVTVYLEFRPI